MGGQVTKGGQGRTDGWVDGQKVLGGNMENGSPVAWTKKTGQMVGGQMDGWGSTQLNDELAYWR